MGHTRLGDLPHSQKWKAVVAAMSSADFLDQQRRSQEMERIAVGVLDAAQTGLDKAIEDIGLRRTFYLLTQLVLAARESDWRNRLGTVGIEMAEGDSTFELTAKIQDAIDDYVSAHGRPTDISEIAQQAAGEAVTKLAEPTATTLFGSGEAELQTAIRSLSTGKGFAGLGQAFFGRFMAHFMNFYLSRATASQIGVGIRDVNDLSDFNNQLRTHCQETAKIVHDFCGEWYSKTEFKEGITQENTSRFMAVALKKLQAELKRQREAL